MVNLKIFNNFCSHCFSVIVKDVNNNIVFNNYPDCFGNILISLNKGVYKIYVNNYYQVFYYDGVINKICFYFGYNHNASIKKIILVDKFYNMPIMKGSVILWQDRIQ